ncbi:MAG: heavy-metal-associated domain-containing protein [Candidatus Eiseniibacteriota bacterium]
MEQKSFVKGARLLAFGLMATGLIAVVAFIAITGASRNRTAATEVGSGTTTETETSAEHATVDGETVEIVRIQVEGMTCGGCATHVATELEKVDGVESCTVDVEGKTAEVRLTRAGVPTQTLLAAVETAGYSARLAP